MSSRAILVALLVGGTAHAQPAADLPPGAAEATATAPPAPTPAAPTPAEIPMPRPPRFPIAFHPVRGGNYLGVELGAGNPADGRNVFGAGLGKTVVLGIRGFEMRVYERYELDDKSGMFGDAQGVRARLSITSVGRRYTFVRGKIAARALIGGAWLRRSSVRFDPDDISSDFLLRSQHGLAAMVGGGVQLGPLTAEIRAYPALWSSLEGDSRYVSVDGRVTTEVIMDSPGGVPITTTIGVGFGF